MKVSSGRLRSILIRTTAILLGLSAALVLMEIMLRVFDLAPTDGLVTVVSRDFDRIPGVFAPNQSLVERQKKELPYHVVIDSLGLRGPGFPRLKQPGELRVLYLGDSFIFGDFVNDDQTIPALLQENLRPVCPGLLIINAGLGGSTISDQIEIFARTVVLDPDVVILGFTENDVTDLGAKESLWERLRRNRESKSRFPLSLAYPILRRTALWNLVQQVFARERTGNPGGMAAATSTTGRGSAHFRPLREEYARGLRDLRDLVARDSVPFYLSFNPSHRTVGDTLSEQLDWLTGIAEEERIQVLNPLPSLRKAPEGVNQLFRLPIDGHPTPMGHRITAAAIAEFLIDLPPFADRCSTSLNTPRS